MICGLQYNVEKNVCEYVYGNFLKVLEFLLILSVLYIKSGPIDC